MVSALSVSALSTSFFLTALFMPYWIKRAHQHGFVGKDLNKFKKPLVAELGGLIVVAGAVIGILAFVALQVFYYNNQANVALLFAAVCSLLIACLIGTVDDLLGWRKGIRQVHKLLLSFLIALPIMVLNAGVSTMNLPFIGEVSFGIFYPLVIVPVAVIGASNAFNMLAGYNGLEAGMGIIALGTLGWLSWMTGGRFAAVIAACICLSLLAFLIYNWYPAKAIPGDALTYSVGASIAIIAVYGNIEKFALIVFIPYFIELLLKARGKMQKQSFSKPMPDKTLRPLYRKTYSLPQAMVKILNKLGIKPTEKKAVMLTLFFEAALACLAVAVFFIQ